MKTNKPMNRLSVRMTKDLAARLRRIAKAEGKPVSAVVRDAMRAAMERSQRGEVVSHWPTMSALVRDALEDHLGRLQA